MIASFSTTKQIEYMLTKMAITNQSNRIIDWIKMPNTNWIGMGKIFVRLRVEQEC